MKKVYLAGYEVFAPNAVERGRDMKKLCEKYGFEGRYPLDNEVSDVKSIFEGNTRLIENCDIVIANLNPFRGNEPDSGTCFEVGYAWAKQKKIYAFVDDIRSMQERFGSVDSNGYAIENFNMAVNLMLGCAAEVVQGGLEDCLKRVKNAE